MIPSTAFVATLRDRWGVEAFLEVYFAIRDEATKAWPNPTDMHLMLGEERLRWHHLWEERRALVLVIEAELHADGTVELLDLDAYELPESTFNGPAVMAGFAQSSRFPTFEQHVRAILFEPTATYDYIPYPCWVDSYVDWNRADDPTAVGELRPGADWRFLSGHGPVSGPLVGGCVEVLEFLKGSRYWPAEEWWTDRSLFLETSEDEPTVEQVRYWLFNYGVQGVFERLSGLIVGRPRGYTDDQKQALDDAIHSVVVEEFGATHVAIATNLDFGHTDPQWILPLRVVAELHPDARTFRLLEPAVD